MPQVTELGDPRLQTMFATAGVDEASARPTVAISKRTLPGWAYAVAVGLAAILLFWALESRRATVVVEESDKTQNSAPLAAPPPLYIPPETVVQQPAPLQVAPQPVRVPAPVSVEMAPVPGPPARYRGRVTGPEAMGMQPPPGPPNRGASSPTVVIDAAPVGPTRAPPPGSAPVPGGTFGNGLPSGTRARASNLANPGQTIAQGAVIPAVLETAFNSTQPGFARAIVSRDVRSFDGSKVLIPRGSRLIGEYRAEVASGQNRAIINWTRLIRGDGVTVALNSPAVDPLGRGGVRARVNNHLFERVTNGLLQSVFSVASSLALRSSRTNVILAPGAANAGPIQPPENQPMRTLSVPAGTSISVFVAQDLEFSARDTGQ
jgi:type IV secretion system protein VirB10